MDTRQRLTKVLERLGKEYPNAKGTDLNYENPLQLLVATILSAQSTDETVNEITSKLFEKYKSAEDFANAEREDLENMIYSSGFFRNKAKWIQESCSKLVKDYGGNVPQDIEELTELKGVGRKTANIVLADAYGVVQGIAVDTHVMRLTKRLGFSNKENRDKMEENLIELVPEEDWYRYTNLLIAHGRQVCEARNPKCGDCPINDLCPSAFSFD